ncbi:MAG: insulinase family protein [Bacteroidaceae bacterium]|nr:insulinase family protein [Bacteroidaceae bacterium]MCF0185792.1 insulinase family protein [Bacteroidaceae bacterium]
MKLDRSCQPDVRSMQAFNLQVPERVVLPNGTRLAVCDGGNMDVFRMDILVRGGQWRQTMPLQASFTNRMLSEGTTTYSSEQLFDLLDRYGAWMNQSTSVNFSVITLYSLNKYAQHTLDVLEKILREPTFPQKEFQVLVDNARQQYQENANKVDTKARMLLNKVLLGKQHPCARFAQLDDYSRIQTYNLSEFYSRHYHCKNVSIYLSGKVNESIRKMVEKQFGTRSWGMDSALVPLVPIPPVSSPEDRYFEEDENSVQSSVRMGMVTIPLSHPDYDDLQVVETVFGGYFGSRLMSNIREEKGYTYGIGSGLIPLPYESLKVVASQCAHEYVNPLIDEVFAEMQRLREETIPAEELEMVKNYMLGDLSRRYENVLSLNDAFIYADSSGLSDDYMIRRSSNIQKITPDRATEVVDKYFKTDQMKVIVVGKNEKKT